MGRNESCWCLSGKKWKRCHRVREDEPSIPTAALLQIFSANSRNGICLHPSAPNECSDQIIRAHTLQKGGSLRAIADSTGHVLSGRDRGTAFSSRAQSLTKVGVNKASTFRGFCSKHDNHVFGPADRAKDTSEEVAFLLSFRALAYEVFMKMVAVPTMEEMKTQIDRGKPFEEQVPLQDHIHRHLYSFKMGLDEHVRIKEAYDTALTSKNLSRFRYMSMRFDRVLPVVTSGAFFPEFDYQGKMLQRLSDDIGSLDCIVFNVCVMNGCTYVVFGWVDVGRTANRSFVESIKSIRSEAFADFVIRFAFEISDNIFVSPSWWHELDSSLKDDLEKRLISSFAGERVPSAFCANLMKYFGAETTAVVLHSV